VLTTLLILTSCRKYHNGPSNPGSVSTTWTKNTSLPVGEKFNVLETSGNTVYAASGSGIVYSSSDLGSTWSASAVVKQGTMISALAVFNSSIYVGTYADGIFASSDGGRTWAHQSAITQITSFTVWNNNLYLSSSAGTSPADGVMVLNQSTGTWSAFNSNGLPSNYDFTTVKLVVANQTLVSVRGVNGFFYSFDSNAGQWSSKDYFAPHRLIVMQDVVSDQGVLLVSSGKLLLNSTNGGTTWSADTVGLAHEPDLITFTPKTRILYSTNGNCYVVSNMPTGGAFIQKRNITSSAGSTWATQSEFLQIPGLTYDIRALNNVLFLATDDGLYYKQI
jgi:photosystem II stability/assembly factor-like uncharacterized protein